MKNHIKKAATATAEFANRHRTTIIVLAAGTVTTAVCVKLNDLAMSDAREFIEAHGLTDEYNLYLFDENE